MNVMTKKGSLDNVITYEHLCDRTADLANIPKSQITLGSTAIVLQNENGNMDIFIANSAKQWIPISTSINGGSSNITPTFELLHICANNEYNATTKIPTISIPDSNIIYLVPNGNNTNNLYDKWIYVNNAWENLGQKIEETPTPDFSTLVEQEVTNYFNENPVEIPAVQDGSVTYAKLNNSLKNSIDNINSSRIGTELTIDKAFSAGALESYNLFVPKGAIVDITVSNWTTTKQNLSVAFTEAGSSTFQQSTAFKTETTIRVIAAKEYAGVSLWIQNAASTLTINIKVLGINEVDTSYLYENFQNLLFGNQIVINKPLVASTKTAFYCPIPKGSLFKVKISNYDSESGTLEVGFGLVSNSSNGNTLQTATFTGNDTKELIADNDYYSIHLTSQNGTTNTTITIDLNDMLGVKKDYNIINSSTSISNQMVIIPLKIKTGQTVNILLSDFVSSNNKNSMIALGVQSIGTFHQTLRCSNVGLYKIIAEDDYDCVYVYINDSTNSRRKVTVWIDGTIKKYNNFSIIGDSYSAYQGYIPEGHNSSYPYNGITMVDEMWWFKFAKEYGSIFHFNESYSGSPICNDGYNEGTNDAAEKSFIARMKNLPQSDLIFVFGGTNDEWIGVEAGEYVYSNWTEAQLSQFRPATAYLLDYLTHHHVGAQIIFIKNTDLTNFSSSIDTICAYYNIPVITLTNAVTKANGHPDVNGMAEIEAQVIEAIIHLQQ